MTAPAGTTAADPVAVLDEIRQRAEAATKGPWLADVLVEAGSRPVVVQPDTADHDAADILFAADAPWVTEDDAEFVAHARSDIPRLLDALDKVLEAHRPGRRVIRGHLCKHHENHRFFSITGTEADSVQACGDCSATVYRSCAGCPGEVEAESCPVRSVIAAALSGEKTPS